MKQWEYIVFPVKVEGLRDLSIPELNKLGEDGWELVAVTSYGNYCETQIFYFKRNTRLKKSDLVTGRGKWS